MTDDELEELKRRKLQEMQGHAGVEDPAAAQAERQEYEAQKQNLLRQILEPEARERLTRVRLARPEIAERLEQQLLVLYQQGRIRGQINDKLLREFLAKVQPKTRETKIERR